MVGFYKWHVEAKVLCMCTLLIIRRNLIFFTHILVVLYFLSLMALKSIFDKYNFFCAVTFNVKTFIKEITCFCVKSTILLGDGFCNPRIFQEAYFLIFQNKSGITSWCCCPLRITCMKMKRKFSHSKTHVGHACVAIFLKIANLIN